MADSDAISLISEGRHAFFLVSSSSVTKLSVFHKSVVLITKQTRGSIEGLIVNKLSRINSDTLSGECSILVHPSVTLVDYGGPLFRDRVSILYNSVESNYGKFPGARKIVDGIYLCDFCTDVSMYSYNANRSDSDEASCLGGSASGNSGRSSRLPLNLAHESHINFSPNIGSENSKNAIPLAFGGYCGWTREQLTGEIEKGCWYVVPAQQASHFLFSGQRGNLWSNLIQSIEDN